MNRPKVGLALGGGGARGYAHLGVIKTLQKHQIPIDIVVGTSMGAVMGGAFACGVDLDKLERVLKTLDLNRLLGIPDNTLKGVEGLVGRTASEYLFKRADWRSVEPVNTKKLFEFFYVFAGDKEFKDLKIPFATVGTDIDTGEEVVLKEGKVYQAIAASVAIPGIHYPVKFDRRFLVDGGIVNKVPIDVAAELGAEIVIAVDVSTPLSSRVETSIDTLVQAAAITAHALTQLKLAQAKRALGDKLLVLRPAIETVRMLHLKQLTLPIKAGEQEAERYLEPIKALLSVGKADLSGDAKALTAATAVATS